MIDRRTALLSATVEEIAIKGTRGMRVEEVAKRAGVSVALIYHHFGDRSTLLRHALAHIEDRAEDYAPSVGIDGYHAVLGQLVAEFQDEQSVRTNSVAWGELRDSAIFDESLRPALAEATGRWVDGLAETVRIGVRDGSITTTLAPVDVGIQLGALVEGLSGRWLSGLLSTAEARRHIEAATDRLLRPRH